MAATVAVIGLGAMGFPVVRHLLAAGVDVVVRDPDGSAVDGARELGARAVASDADAGRLAEAVAVFVPTDRDVLDVCLGSSGVLAGARPGQVVLLCSSVLPATCWQVAAAAPARVDILDAALTGGVRGAVAGEINLLVGGDVRALARVRPLLEPWTAAVHHLGPLGCGQVGKAANNLLHWAQISAITEALELARRAGVDIVPLRRALMDGPADSRTLRELDLMRLTWHAKDLANTAELAKSVDLEIPMAEAARRVMSGLTVADVARLLAGGSLHEAAAGNFPVTLRTNG